MPRYSYERLSAQDNSFLLVERPNAHMHVAGVQIFEAGPLRTPEGGIDIVAIKRATAAVLHLIPRYRQKLKWIPYESRAVWVDDRRFSLDYHIRHTALPRPGTDEQLRALAARVMSQQLDRGKPLWESWIVEGLEGDRFAFINKIHHCMIDGASGVDLAQILLSLTPDQELVDPLPYIPRPAPSGAELLVDQWQRRVSLPRVALRSMREFSDQAEDLRHELGIRAKAVGDLLGYAFQPASETPMNGRLGPHRRFEWLSMPLEEVKALRRVVGCTVNDLILATVAGAVRSYLIRRRVDPAGMEFRVAAPVSVRQEEDRGKLGNKVSSWVVPLPIGEAEPLRRIKAIHAVTGELKESHQALGVSMLMAAAEWTPAQLLSLGAQAASGPINMIVTNVPGPQFPLYLLGARLLEMFPVVPLLENTGIGVALFSYDGRLFWGVNSDPDLVPDLPEFIKAIRSSFKELKKAASLRPAERQKAATPHLRAVDPPAAREEVALKPPARRTTARKRTAKPRSTVAR